MCRVTILNENGIPVTVEVSREIYQVFVDYEREIERQRKADFRHRDARSWDTCLIFEVSTETLEQTYERIRTLHEIQEALNEFTPKQRRRFLLHFAYGYTYMEIAKMEGSNKSNRDAFRKGGAEENSEKAGCVMTTFARSQSFIVKGEIFPFHSWNLDKQRATVHIQYSSF